ncbi:two-component system, OmpR family, sensor histidine kinase PhoQ [Colwellia chukchiensis]|uniref:histidine kinase n=1 Tax=Colwellia chukchiensis TaxID=641665 RepID=A0A1H7K982_9GAMM|nr:ATP-binding protein [Colwellia chukchiensis]SEK83379.1 two-component system, OmpR family, sensor histidine kinase PhoQ [Colwellia chukchiensis]
MIFILLPIVGIIISNAFEKHMIASIKNELSAYSYAILAIIEVEDDSLIMPEQLLETQFNVSQSGLYALLTSHHDSNSQANLNNSLKNINTLWRSQSVLTPWSEQALQYPKLGRSAFYQAEQDAQLHFIYSLSVSYGSESQPFTMTLHIIKQQDDLTEVMRAFHQQLILGLASLMLVLLFIQYLWSLWTLKPLKTLGDELSNVEQGKADRLKQSYPLELNQLTEQLNLLLSAEQKQRQRYRNALSDLAHSLKTPLAVLQTQANLSPLTQQQLSTINAIIEHQLRKAQSAGQSSWYLGVAIAPLVSKLLNSLEKIYQDKALNFKVNIAANLNFKGDEADFLEILGNILDNACKAAKKQLQLDIYQQDKQLLITVQDDGIGIDPAKSAAIMQRGTRADTYQQGHGIGLAIVRDLVESYQGSIAISSAKQLNGAQFTITLPQ